jgi:17beta-estradiol 17-dehydrogenase / very-long-chain 3-oxoacyl-CoA reductase
MGAISPATLAQDTSTGTTTTVFQRILHVCGLAFLSYFAARIINFVRLYTSSGTLARYHRPDAWALVTGASDGIGRAFATALASHGFNVILHGRNETKLQGVLADLQKLHPDRKFRIVIADASQSHGMKDAVEGIVSSLSDLDGPLCVLINNVGGLPSTASAAQMFTAVSDQDWAFTDGAVNMNARFPVQLTRALLPILQKSQPSLIMNMGSIAGVMGLPFTALYSGTKALNLVWSNGLARELQWQGHDIEVLGLVVGEVTGTVFFKEQPTLIKPSATTFVQSALDRVGCGRLEVVPYWGHSLAVGLMRSVPEGVATMTMRPLIQKVLDLERNKKKAV